MLRHAVRALLVIATLAPAAAAQTAGEIVARNLEAKGGVDRLKSLDSLKITGTMTVQGKALPLTILSKRPNLVRQELVVGGTTVIQAFDGTRAWATNPIAGGKPQELPPEATAVIGRTAEFDTAFLDYEARGHTIELTGSDTLDGTPVHRLKLTTSRGDVQHFVIDAKTGLELRASQEVEIGPGQKQSVTTEMRDYKPVDGVLMPHEIRRLVDGKILSRLRISRIEVNTIPDDSLFRMP
jgi:outer membrane lipoprotein-sorting protein